jgi:hypothetical protein
VRHWKTFDRKGDADRFRDTIGQQARNRLTPAAPSTINMREYSSHWKKLICQSVKPRTLGRYAESLDVHILPRLELNSLSTSRHAALLAPFVCVNLARGRSESCIRARTARPCDDRIDRCLRMDAG